MDERTHPRPTAPPPSHSRAPIAYFPRAILMMKNQEYYIDEWMSPANEVKVVDCIEELLRTSYFNHTKKS